MARFFRLRAPMTHCAPIQLEALKRKAFELEQRKQVDQAIATYREILALFDSGVEPSVDVSLYNRFADLLVRRANTVEAVAIYERAVDLYFEAGFFNKAIALCNKILRTCPGRASVYYKLGKLSCAKGLMSEARRHFLEYAERMRNSGHTEEAFRALEEFASLAVQPKRQATDCDLVFLEVGAPLEEKPRGGLVFIDIDARTSGPARRASSGALLSLSA